MEFQALFYCLIKETIFLNSMKVVAKRILIVGFIVATLIVLEVTSEESMMNNLPTHDEIVQSIIDRNEQTAVIDQAFEDGYDQEAEYEKERKGRQKATLKKLTQKYLRPTKIFKNYRKI